MKMLESPFEKDIPGKPNLPYFDQSVAYERGWMLELQAPQGPYTNVLDLQVFPAMSK